MSNDPVDRGRPGLTTGLTVFLLLKDHLCLDVGLPVTLQFINDCAAEILRYLAAMPATLVSGPCDRSSRPCRVGIERCRAAKQQKSVTIRNGRSQYQIKSEDLYHSRKAHILIPPAILRKLPRVSDMTFEKVVLATIAVAGSVYSVSQFPVARAQSNQQPALYIGGASTEGTTLGVWVLDTQNRQVIFCRRDNNSGKSGCEKPIDLPK